MITKQQQADVLPSIAASSVATEQATGCPAILSMGQCIAESYWLTRAPGNNPFGIKYNPKRHSASITVSTHEYINGKYTPEVLIFAAFPSLQAAFEEHADLITHASPYAEAWADYLVHKDPEQLLRGIAPHYAPGNLHYADSVLAIMRQSNVVAAMVVARQAHPVVDHA